MMWALTIHAIVLGTVTFADVSPIFAERCVGCHRPGGVAPMSLMTFDEARPWAKGIEREVTARRMPPFDAAGPIGLWKHDLRLTDAEIALIAEWVRGGPVRGESAAPIAIPVPETAPDPGLILTLPVYTIPASGLDSYAEIASETVFEEELWVSGLDWISEGLLHHASLHVLDIAYWPFDSFVLDEGEPVPHGDAVPLALYVPGSERVRFPEGYALKLPKGGRLVVVAHYAPSEVSKMDQVRIGFHFADGFVREFPQQLLAHRAMDLDIPPHTRDYAAVGRVIAQEDLVVFGSRVHMHLRGKSAKFTIVNGEDAGRVLFEVPRYNFHWQRTYTYAEPFVVRKGTEIEFERRWDNSSSNAANPDPNLRVVYGERTHDEMGACHLFAVPLDDHRAPLRVKAGRRMSYLGTN